MFPIVASNEGRVFRLEELDGLEKLFYSSDDLIDFLRVFEKDLLRTKQVKKADPKSNRNYFGAIRELFDFVQCYRQLAENHLLEFPLRVRKFDRPDFVVVEDDRQYGLEATTASEQMYEQWLAQNIGRPWKRTYLRDADTTLSAETYAVDLILYAIERKSRRTLYYQSNSGCHIQNLLMRLKCYGLPDLSLLTAMLREALADFKPALDFRRIYIVTHSRRLIYIRNDDDGMKSLTLL